MTHLEQDWESLLGLLPVWEKLSTGARRTLLDLLKPSAAIPRSQLGDDLHELAESGLVRVTDARASIAESARGLVRALRSMDRHRDLAEQPMAHRFEGYLRDHFTIEESTALVYGSKRDHFGWTDRQEVLRQLTATDWVEDFLALEGAEAAREWEDRRRTSASPSYLVTAEVLQATQRLVRRTAEEPTGLALGALVSEVSSRGPIRARAVHAAIRYVLCLAVLDPTTLSPVLLVWPPARERLLRTPAEPPGTIEPIETFHAATLMEDMTAVLVAAAGEPLRLRANDLAIFARQRQSIESRLLEVPDWVESTVGPEQEDRVEGAASNLELRKLTRIVGKAEGEVRLAASKPGSRWLALNEHDRLRELIEPLRKSSERNPPVSTYGSSGMEITFFPSGIGFTLPEKTFHLRRSLIEAYLSAPKPGYVAIGDFFDFHSRNRNPFLRGQAALPDSRPGGWGRRPSTRQEWEGLWYNILVDFLKDRLVPLGGVQLGIAADGHLGFELTDIGRYLFGTAQEFTYGHQVDAEVIVQPNFEIVFLARAPQVEARLARLAERIGAGPGVMFRLTRESVLAAAETGLGAEDALELLSAAASRELPANVARQVRDWYSGVRRVSIQRALLIHCPDEATAGRVRAAGGKGLKLLTSTIVEMEDTDSRSRAALVRKLRKAGVFVEQ